MSSEKHNAALFPIMRMIVDAAPEESDQWVLLESMALAVGRLHGRSDRDVAEFLDVMSERLASGARAEKGK